MIGSGLAGYAAAVSLKDRKKSVAVLSLGPGASALSSGAWSFGRAVRDASFESSFSLTPWKDILAESVSDLTPALARQSSERISQALAPHIEIAWSWDRPYCLPTSLGEWRYCYGAQAVQANATAANLSGKKVGLVGSKRWRWQQIEVLNGLSTSFPETNRPEIKWNSLELPFPENGIDWPLPRIFALLNHDEKKRDLFLSLLSDCAERAKADFILLPPLFSEKVRMAAQSRLQIPFGECLATLEPSAGYRLHQAIEASLLERQIPHIRAKKITLNCQNGRIDRVLVSSEAGPQNFEPKAVVLATGKLFGGGIRLGYEAVSESLINLPLFTGRTSESIALRSQLDWAQKTYSEPQSWAKLGLWIDKGGVPRDGSGTTPIQNVRACGSILGGVDWALEGLGLGAAALTGVLCVQNA